MNKATLFFAGLSLLLLGVLIGSNMDRGTASVADLLSTPAYGQSVIGKDDTRTVTTSSSNGDTLYVWVHAKQEVLKYWIEGKDLKMQIFKATGLPSGASTGAKPAPGK